MLIHTVNLFCVTELYSRSMCTVHLWCNCGCVLIVCASLTVCVIRLFCQSDQILLVHVLACVVALLLAAQSVEVMNAAAKEAALFAGTLSCARGEVETKSRSSTSR